ncbi:carboxypeptidase regulatory-like domain-containing protein [Mangrovimonas sp. ST2L15]|uniref:carboxypeptidase regulatory-like domain-containing protein n=1 Tax=Mangrovimonas sp. ST2L15 TaxID=1645916 RepID=UPI0006B4F337|nr:carboxypeptidase regulatory-like domain-containing protein [Mangrovimonas sp. ST2L15]
MKQIIIVLCLIISGQAFSQITLQGVVKDSVGNPLELANVIAINKVTNALESYGITNDKGKFKLDLETNSMYSIQVSYVGMKTYNEEVATGESNVIKDFTLSSDNTLDEVELVYEMPVTVKGDTLVYNADSFKSGTERKLEDVLKKLPGVEIDDDGQIKVEGKTVSKVMVEGKDFFDGDSKLATKNIPSDAVDKVQVLKNFAEVGQLSGVQNNQDNIAINIKLKEGKDNFWFGTVTAGAGLASEDGLYLVQPKLFYYNPKYSINFIGDLNNIGEVAFTRRDYFNFSGGFRMPSRQSGTNISLGNNNLGFLTMQNNRAKEINSKFAALNFSYSPKKTLDLSGFAIFTSNRTRMQENNSIQYTNSNLGIPDEDTQTNTNQKSDLGMVKLSAKYKPNSSNQLDYDILARTSKESQDQYVVSSVLGNTDQSENSDPYSINQNLNYYYTLNDKNIFALEVQHLLQDEDPFYNAVLENMDGPDDADNYYSTADGLGLDLNQSVYNINQEKRVKTNQLDAKLDYWYVLNQKSNLNLTLGTIYSNQKFNSNIFQLLDSNETLDPAPSINDGLIGNDINYTFSDLYMGLHYQLKAGIFTFTPGFSVHSYSSKNEQFNIDYTNNFFQFLPDFDTRIQLKKSEHININYRMQTQFTDVNQLAEGIVMNNYNSFFTGNYALENSLSHNVSLTYFSFNMFNYTNVFANINYNKNIDQIRNQSIFEDGSVIRLSSPFNSNFSDESLSANGRFQRTFKKLRATASANFSYTKFNQFINGLRSINENYNQNYRMQLGSNFREAPNFEVGYRFGIQDSDLGTTYNKTFTNAPSVEFDALIWKRFTFRTEYAYTRVSPQDREAQVFDFWDASLNYRKDQDAKWEFELKATNLLNTQSQSQTNVSDFSISINDYYIQPRFITLRAVYNL